MQLIKLAICEMKSYEVYELISMVLIFKGTAHTDEAPGNHFLFMCGGVVFTLSKILMRYEQNI
jgi:hypothetical protein